MKITQSLFALLAPFINLKCRQIKNLIQLQSSADDIRFAAQIDPLQAAASISIFIGFGAIQTRISNSNRILAKIANKRKELNDLKASILSGQQEAISARDLVLREIESLEKDWTETVTFISLPGLALRFRVAQDQSQLTDIQRSEESMLKIKDAVSDIAMENIPKYLRAEGEKLDDDFSDEKNKLLVPSWEKTTATQKFLLFVGVVLVSSLLSLLNMLLADPMTSGGVK